MQDFHFSKGPKYFFHHCCPVMPNLTCLSAVCLSVYFEDTLLAVWRHGWQRRGQGFTEVLEETTDPRKTYRLVQSDRMVVLETRQIDDQTGMSNLYVLEIAENYVMLP
ncbi:mitogen-activated protein kinase kinase kinase kinase 3 [Notothenia coriiceps]|uniref:Mitogen-activated protein kinase kinase kinase kinase 3 n=1 Tax=Notothenia coriiceps TaxID=8208 RepID=A0A6I9NU03_9TELE|nr:PREDICTED: mitogen-activated protein kinase kinase kinase kinase 3-like [Notothenia coriiceps]